MLAEPRIHYGASFPETQSFVDLGSVTLKIEHRLHDSGTALLGVSCHARRARNKSFFLGGGGKATGGGQPLSMDLLVS